MSALERRVSLSQPQSQQSAGGHSAPIQVHEANVYSLLQESDTSAQHTPPAERERARKAARRLREVFSSEWHSWIRGAGEKDADVMPKSSVGLFIETRFGRIYDATALEMALAFVHCFLG